MRLQQGDMWSAFNEADLFFTTNATITGGNALNFDPTDEMLRDQA